MVLGPAGPRLNAAAPTLASWGGLPVVRRGADCLDRRVAACEPDAPRQGMRDEAFWSPKLDAFKRAVEDDARN
jgi:hypothetical protein